MPQPPERASGPAARRWGAGPSAPGEPPPGWPAPPPPPGDWSAPGWAPPRRNAPAVASFFLGIVAVPAFFFLLPGAILGIVALALGLIGRRRAERGEADAKGAATAGVVLGSLAIVATIVWGVTLYVVDARNQDRYEECLRLGAPPRVCVDRHRPSDP